MTVGKVCEGDVSLIRKCFQCGKPVRDIVFGDSRLTVEVYTVTSRGTDTGEVTCGFPMHWQYCGEKLEGNRL